MIDFSAPFVSLVSVEMTTAHLIIGIGIKTAILGQSRKGLGTNVSF
ncbi:MAG: hypothetical protein K8R02_06905 [Anaerohalosphaeraceae bacterium]|nr:hypothetical protein [Anaerohalosphaeraceae bacterium]